MENNLWIHYTKTNSGLPDDRIRSLAFDANENIILGLDYGFLSIFNPNGSWQNYEFPELKLIGNSTRSLLSDSDGRIWMGTRPNGFIPI